MIADTQFINQAAEDALKVYNASKNGLAVPEVDIAYIEGFKEGVSQQAQRAEQDWAEAAIKIANTAIENAMKVAAHNARQVLRGLGVSEDIIAELTRKLEDQAWLSTF